MGHDIHDINGIVGDTPDATAKLWNTYTDQGYILVGLSGNATGNKLGNQNLTKDVQDQYVYLKYGVKKITPKTPTSEIPKNSDGTPVVNPADLHKEFNRTISYKANTEDGPTLKDQTKQHTEFNGSVVVDLVTGKTVVSETVKDVNGNDVEVATDKPGAITWDKASDSFAEVKQPTISLDKENKYATSDEMVGSWHQINGKADKVDLTPDSGNPADEVLVYEKNKSDTGIPLVDPEKPAITVDQETKTFTRTIVYRGTKDGGKTYEDANGSPDGTHEYRQTVTFTRNVLKDKDDNVLSTTDWKSDTSDMPQVDSKDPKKVGYNKVDIPSVDKLTVDPNSSTTDLGKTVVTYTTTSTPVVPLLEETHHVTVHYVDTDGNVIKNPIKDRKDYKNGESYNENDKKDTTISYNGKTYEFVKVQDGDNPTGTINKKDVDVTYVYKLKKDTSTDNSGVPPTTPDTPIPVSPDTPKKPSQPAPKNSTPKKHEKHTTTHVTKESKKETKEAPKSVTHKSVRKSSKYTESNIAAKGENASRRKEGLTLLAPKSEKTDKNRAALAEINELENSSSSTSMSAIGKATRENSSERTLPQAGEKNDKVSFLGAVLSATSFATLLGLAVGKKKKRN